MELPGLKEAYESMKDRSSISYEMFKQETRNFIVYPVSVRGKICGAILVSGREIHACILPWAKGRWFGRAAARVLNSVIDEYGEATTHATTPEGKKFVEALGFQEENGIYRSKRKWVLNRS